MHRISGSIQRLAVLVVATFSLVAGMLPAGTAFAQAGIPEVTYRAAEYSFSGPDQLQAGWVALTLQNAGKEEHHLQLLRLHDGKTLADFDAALKTDNIGNIFAISDATGGVPETPPGASAREVVNLQPGSYVMTCFISDEDNVPHAAKGMVKALQVVANTGGTSAAPPTATISVRAKDFAFSMPAQVAGGSQTWQMMNDGPEPHEMVIMKVAAGKTMQDVQAYLSQQHPSGPPPAEAVGGFQAMNPGMTAYATLDLQPGNYFAICFVPDPKTGKSHAELGMVQAFTVSAGAGTPAGGTTAAGAATGAGSGTSAGSPPRTLPVTGGTPQWLWTVLVAGQLLAAAGWLLRRSARQA